jgi:ABC-type uncharacterized transport system permease subunit
MDIIKEPDLQHKEKTLESKSAISILVLFLNAVVIIIMAALTESTGTLQQSYEVWAFVPLVVLAISAAFGIGYTIRITAMQIDAFFYSEK